MDNGESFAETMDMLMLKLSQLNDTMIELKNFEQLLTSLKKKAEAEDNNTEEKVAMVDSMVSQFIKGNSMRAQQTLSRPAKPNPAMLKAKEVLENFEQKLKGLQTKNSYREKGEVEKPAEKQPVVEKLKVVDRQNENPASNAEGRKPDRTVRPVEQSTSTVRTKGYDLDIGARAPATATATEQPDVDNNGEDAETFEETMLQRPVVATNSETAAADAAELDKLLLISSVKEVKVALMHRAQADPDQAARLLANLFEYQDPAENRNTVAEIRDMIGKDLESVTDAFADLIMKSPASQTARLRGRQRPPRLPQPQPLQQQQRRLQHQLTVRPIRRLLTKSSCKVRSTRSQWRLITASPRTRRRMRRICSRRNCRTPIGIHPRRWRVSCCATGARRSMRITSNSMTPTKTNMAAMA